MPLDLQNHRAQLVLTALGASVLTASAITAYQQYARQQKRRDLREDVLRSLADGSKGKGKQRADAEADAPQSLLTDPIAFFGSLGFSGLPPVSTLNRPLIQLLSHANVWSMSIPERVRLAEEWERKIRNLAYNSQLDEYQRLKEEYEEACKDYDDMRDEVRASQLDIKRV